MIEDAELRLREDFDVCVPLKEKSNDEAITIGISEKHLSNAMQKLKQTRRDHSNVSNQKYIITCIT